MLTNAPDGRMALLFDQSADVFDPRSDLFVRSRETVMLPELLVSIHSEGRRAYDAQRFVEEDECKAARDWVDRRYTFAV